jgi:hypothetical protein
MNLQVVFDHVVILDGKRKLPPLSAEPRARSSLILFISERSFAASLVNIVHVIFKHVSYLDYPRLP